MLTFAEARALAECWVTVVTRSTATLVDTATLTRPYGWVFFYQSPTYLESGAPGEVLAGNPPILVDRFGGEIRITGTAYPVEHYLAEYEKTLPPARLAT
jgi:hypothetical protein